MANTKISALTAATTPLAGTETLPVVQSSATTKVAVSDLTAGRSVSGANFVVTSSTIPANGVYLSATNSVGIATNSTLRATIDASGNLGIGVTPNAWGSAYNVIQLGAGNFTGAFAQWRGNNQTLIVSNAYNDGTNWIYRNTGPAAYYRAASVSPEHTWFLAASGTAGSTITWTQSMTLSATSNLTLNVGNVVQGTAAKGFDFSANTPAAGKTSTILNWYEEGTWTPNQGAGLTLVGAFSSTGKYTRIGRNVTISGTVTGATSVAVTAAGVITTSLPFTIGTAGHGNATNAANNASAAIICNTGTTVTSAGAIAATGTITFSATYFV
jgi:hypothetical protein